MDSMRSVIWTDYGGPEVLETGLLDKPVPGKGEILIKISNTSVTQGDCEARSMNLPFLIKIMMRLMFGVSKPVRKKVLGQEFSGVVEEAENSVEGFSKGDRVFGSPGISMGAYAEYLCMKAEGSEGVISKTPEDMDDLTAAVLTIGGLEALHFFGKSDIGKGSKVLVNGAGGSIGTVFIQLAKEKGAEITAVDRNEKFNMLDELGADYKIDYREKDFSESDKKYDYVFDVVGKGSFRRSIGVLKDGGTYLLANPTFSKIFMAFLINTFTRKSVVVGASDYDRSDLDYMAKLVVKKKLKIVIDRVFSLEDIKAAHEYVESGMKKGNVVINVVNAK